MPMNLAIHEADVVVDADPVDGSGGRLIESATVLARRGVVRVIVGVSVEAEAIFERIDEPRRGELYRIHVPASSSAPASVWTVVRNYRGCGSCGASRDPLAGYR